jgi:hypothetical protein
MMSTKYLIIYAIMTVIIAGSTGFTIAQDQAAMMISAVMFSKNPIKVGEDQTITVTVIDASTNKLIEGATVAITSNPPDFATTYNFTNTTNVDGQMTYTIPLEDNALPGDYFTNIQISKQGYTQLGEFTHFIVLPP